MPSSTSKSVSAAVLALLTVIGAGCDAISVPEQIDGVVEIDVPPDRIVFQMRSAEKTVAGCVAGTEGCAYAHFDYPVITEAPEGAATELVTGAIRDFLLAIVPTDDEEAAPKPKSLSELAERFLAAYATAAEEEPPAPEWTLERKAFVHHTSPTVVSLGFLERSYTGGEHGNETLRFVNLDPRTGAPIALDDVLAEGARETLASIAEARFREARVIEPGADLGDAGFSFEGGAFALTDNFAIGEDGVTFYYNAGDVAPYELGSTEFVLGYEELEGVWQRPSNPNPPEAESPSPVPPEPPSSPQAPESPTRGASGRVP